MPESQPSAPAADLRPVRHSEREWIDRAACHCWPPTALLTANRATPRRRELGLTLPAAGTPKANYTIACWESPTRLYLSGHLPIK